MNLKDYIKNTINRMKQLLRIRIEYELINELKQMKERTGYSISFIIRTIIRDYLKRYKSTKLNEQ
jgi:metal-responsive CopG/Arc/MetJ family transcriptional regulator